MLFTTKWLTDLFGDYKGSANDSIEIDEVTTDSRKKTRKSLFIPLVGEKVDGHDYIKEAFNQGAVAALWDKDRDLPSFLPTDFPVFLVDDTLSAMQEIASAYRDKVNPTVIGITGSNGKTTTKDMVAAVVGSSQKAHHTKGNLNNHIGLPLTILSMPPDSEILVVEMGMNHFGEIETLSRIAKPDIAVITNIGESHIEYLGSREGIAKAKLEIIKGMPENGYLIIDGDEALLRQMQKRYHVITCGFDGNNDVTIKKINLTQEHTQFQLGDNRMFSIPLLGSHHALNAVFAITISQLLKLPTEEVKQALTSLALPSMRFEILNGREGAALINDAYNASPTSMKAAINVVEQMEGYRQRVLVLGDILELGDKSKGFHQEIAESIDQTISAVLTFGDYAYHISDAVNQLYDSIDSRHFTSRESMLSAIEGYLREETLILFKASRGMQFELLVEKVIDPS